MNTSSPVTHLSTSVNPSAGSPSAGSPSAGSPSAGSSSPAMVRSIVQSSRPTALATVESSYNINTIQQQINQIQRLMREVMQKNQHFGVVPGTNKPTLLKPGAEKLCLMFRLDPQYDIKSDFQDSHLTVTSTCTLYHIPTGQRYGSGMGLCSSKEAKYAYRYEDPTCPLCQTPALMLSKYGKGYYCNLKKNGCGKTIPANHPDIENTTKQIPNPQIVDTFNTVLKMANKRSLVAAVLNVTAASDIFTQDIDEDIETDIPLHKPHASSTQFSSMADRLSKVDTQTGVIEEDIDHDVAPVEESTESLRFSKELPESKYITLKQRRFLYAKWKEANLSAEEVTEFIKNKFSIEKASELTNYQLSELLTWIDQRKHDTAVPTGSVPTGSVT